MLCPRSLSSYLQICIAYQKPIPLRPQKFLLSSEFSLLEDHFYSGSRTGLSRMTISAEGTWNSSTGNLCMVCCIGLENDTDGCDSRICLYLPGIFSITQRNFLSGIISSIKEAYVPLQFKKGTPYLDIWNMYHGYSKSYLSYRFTRIEMLRAFMQKDNSYNLGMLITKIIHRFPGIEDDRNLTLFLLYPMSFLSRLRLFPMQYGTRISPKYFFHSRCSH